MTEAEYREYLKKARQNRVDIKHPVLWEILNASKPINVDDVLAKYAGKNAGAFPDIYLGHQTAFRQYPPDYNAAGLVHRSAPNLAQIGTSPERFADVAAHEAAHTQQNRAESAGIKPAQPISLEALVEMAYALKRSAEESGRDVPHNMGLSEREIMAEVQAREAVLDAGKNIFDSPHYDKLGKKSRREIEQRMFPTMNKVFPSDAAPSSPSGPTLLDLMRRNIRNYTAR